MIDAHHHLWNYSKEEYSWIPDGSRLAQSYLLPELESATENAGVQGTVVVQARQILEESDWLLSLSEKSDKILGVVGWAPLIKDSVGPDLERLAAHPKFKGLRHVLQDEPDDYFLRDDFHRGLAKLPSLNLRYDLLLFQRQLPVALQLVDRQPELGIIVDHIAKPEAQNGRIEEAWKKGMQELAQRDNILGVKFSGLVTEFTEDSPADEATIRAYFHETLEIFGANRVMIGTDWPVCLLRLESYSDWVETARNLTEDLSTIDRQAIQEENCRRCYQL